MSALATFGGRRALVWALPLAVVLANFAWMSLFGSGGRLRARELERRLQAAAVERADVARRLATRERLWIAATDNRARTEQLFRERFSTELEGFTQRVRQLKELAVSAGLDPQAFSYPEESFAEYGLTRRSFVFPVDGDYGSLRTLLHLIEVSPTFFNLEQISVGEGSGRLSVRLRLSTLFESAASDAAAAARRAAAPVSTASPYLPTEESVP